MSEVLAIRAPSVRLRDFVDLGKPRLSLLVLFTAATGLWVAPSGIGFGRSAVFLLATSCLVAAANTLNCWVERDLDARMHRTRERPLPAGRLEPAHALTFGLLLGSASLAALALSTNMLTTLLGALALVSYVMVYTPLKRVTPWALFVGAVPGAIPPLMGYTAVTGTPGTAGWLLFCVLFTWQLPHFVAIALYLEDDYRRGGVRVLPIAHGQLAARQHLFAYSVLMVLVSLAGWQLGVAGPVYLGVALLLGVPFLVQAARGLRSDADVAWARRIFGWTLLYLPILVTTLVLDRL